MQNVRIARVKATGAKYLVVALNIDSGTVTVHGEIAGFSALRATGAITSWSFRSPAQSRLARADVELLTVPANKALGTELVAQANRVNAAKPARVVSAEERAAAADMAAIVRALDIKLGKVAR